MKAWDKGFNQGYLCAVANIMRTHGEDVIAKDVLRGGPSRKEAMESDIDGNDMVHLIPLYDEIDRLNNLPSQKK